MKSINSLRIKNLNDKPVREDGEFVLYWMQANRRVYSHFGLQYAVAYANKLNKPLLVYEGLRTDYPWASARFHTFIMEGMAEQAAESIENGWNYFPYVEQAKGEGRGLVAALCNRACLIISDWFPTFIFPAQNEAAAAKSPVKYVVVDSNGILPMAVSEKPSYSAYIFRRTIVQKRFLEAWEAKPEFNPLEGLLNRSKIDLSLVQSRWPAAFDTLKNIESSVAKLAIDQQVKPLSISGTRKAALSTLINFLEHKLPLYANRRNHPDDKAYSGLSPYLHFGKLSAHEIADAVLSKQPEGWTPELISFADGQNKGFFKGDENVESFMDEFITWREIGYHFCNQVLNYDQFETLPDWVQKTLSEHDEDAREYVYSLEEFEYSKTHDVVWNAAQTQLRTEGIIHNYLRMLWGKKILEWSPNARIALQTMIHLNNKYSIDGRNPNSYSGIFWVLGRFDRPWAPARPVFGTVRFMSTASTLKKISLKKYLVEFAGDTEKTPLGL